MLAADKTLHELKELAKEVKSKDPRPEWLCRMMRSSENLTLYPFVYEKWRWGRNPEDLDDNALYYRFLYAVADRFTPSNIVEIGTAIGWSAIHLAGGNRVGKTISIDIDAEAIKRGSLLAKKFGLLNIEFITSDSCDAKILERLPKTIDILYIDGEHTYERSCRELAFYGPRIKSGGIVILDDIRISDEMKALWESIRLPKIDVSWLHEVYGVGFGAFVKP